MHRIVKQRSNRVTHRVFDSRPVSQIYLYEAVWLAKKRLDMRDYCVLTYSFGMEIWYSARIVDVAAGLVDALPNRE